jgi:phosphoglucosamine mutase
VARLFGTDGIRGRAGEYPLDDATVARIGAALAEVMNTTGRAPRLLIGRDTRESGPAIEAALTRGIEAAGGRVDSAGVTTTPAVACVTRLLGYDAGIVVSASHNPYRDNGIKVFAGGGQKLSEALEADVERRIASDGAVAAAGGQKPGAAPGDPAPPGHIGPEAMADRYLAWLLGSFDPPIDGRGLRVALDCANGAAARLAPELFRRIGAEAIPLHDRPDGRNINRDCGALHPLGLAAEVTRARASLGLAFDGDADRCLPVDSSGRVLTGDHILYLVAVDLRRRDRLRESAVVGTVMSNLWLERALATEGIRLLRAPVGDKYVLEAMERSGAVVGGEPSGHIIFLDQCTTGDGLLTGLRLIELLLRTGTDLASWAATVRPCPQILVNVPVRERPPLELHPAIGPAIRDEESRLGGRGRLLVRYSGTEPQARIMVEADSQSLVEECAARLKTVIEAAIGADRP